MSKPLAALFVLLAIGCGGPREDEEISSQGPAPLTTPTFSAAATQQILDLVNYPGTSAVILVTAGLTTTAAKNIVAAHNGADGVSPSADDVAFTTLAELDSVSGVGSASLTKLATYAAAHPAPSAESVKGVAFAGWQVEAVAWGVNQATSDALDAMLDNRAAASLLAHRPFTTVTSMGALSYVGAAALAELQSAAAGWWTQQQQGSAPSLAGRFDGAVFDEADAETALQIANQATAAQLTSHGFTATPAADLIAARPFATLTQVAAVHGVGSATMNALLAYAQGGQWGASCVSTFEAAVAPELPALLFMSESDRPFDLVSYPGAGTAAPTGASVLALVGAVAGSTAEVRDVSNYYVDFEPSGSGDANAGMVVQAAITAQLTDLIYVAVHPPAGSENQALVDVYLLGRTSCGDLVGLHSISVET